MTDELKRCPFCGGEAEILYYEMPGGIRFPVGEAVRGAEPFAHAEGTTYPVTATITMVERSDDD